MRQRAWGLAAAVALTTTLLAPGVAPATGAGPASASPAPSASSLSASASAAPASLAGRRRPNILVVFADDMRRDDFRYMPKTRRLIGRPGTSFTRSLSENPLCCPFRSVLLTGQYTHNNGVLSNKGDNGGFSAFNDRRTLPVTLKKRGYNTGYVGKYLNGYPASRRRGDRKYVPPGWNQWHVPVGSVYAPFRQLMNHNGRLQRQRGYTDDYYGRVGSQMISRLASRRKPFFAAISYLAPHAMTTNGGKWGPPVPPKRYRGSLRGKMPKRMPGAFNEADVSDKPAYIRRLSRLSAGLRQRMRVARRARAESLRAVDDSVARNVAALRRSGELRNTMVVFTSDNGLLLGEHRLTGKKILAYEESVRVPMVIRGPGFRRGSRSRTLVGAVDMASTIAYAARIRKSLPYPVDGRDLRRVDGRILLEAGASLVRGFTNPSGGRGYVGVRTNRYTYVRYWTGEEELYDLVRDPDQRQSVHDDPAYAAELATLRRDTEKLKDCVGTAECRNQG